jgi:hypothetical protein
MRIWVYLVANTDHSGICVYIYTYIYIYIPGGDSTGLVAERGANSSG